MSPPIRSKTKILYWLPKSSGTRSEWLLFPVTNFKLSDFDNFYLFRKPDMTWSTKGNGMHKLGKQIYFKLSAYNPSKEICTFLVFLNYTSGYLKFCKIICIFELAYSRAFQKMCISSFFGHFIIWKHFCITGVCKKYFNFWKFFCRF